MSPNITYKADTRILLVLMGIAAKYKRQWCYPNQQTILTQLQRWHRTTISRRTLCRHMLGLEARGYLRRIRRHSKDRTGALILKSTVYTIQGAAWALLGSTRAMLRHLSTGIVDNFNPHAVPKTAQKARLESLIMNHQHREAKKRLRW